MNDKEKLIIEHRLAEATKKNYKGLDGKFGVILKTLGQPILSEDSAYHSSNEFPDLYEYSDDDLPIYDIENTQTREIGKMFDGLKFGAHLEITYLDEARVEKESKNGFTEYEIMEKVLTVSYKSYPVYREIENELYSFLPGDWEKDIARIYDLALKVKKNRNKERIIEYKEEDKKERIKLLDRLKKLWGI